MEGGKQSGSSLASDLFGANDSSSAAAASSSSGIFGSMFPPPSKVGRESYHYSETEKKISSQNPTWTAKNGIADRNAVGGEGQNKSTAGKDGGSYYTDEKVQPFHYSSSIYYGGQDVYNRPESAQNPGTTFSKDNGEDDSGSASRGNWWQGSLYY